MENKSDEQKAHGTVAESAPVAAPAAPKMTIERQGDYAEPVTHRMPQVRGGICEWCGTVDPHRPSEEQYLLCPHYREIGQVRCSYCPPKADTTEVTLRSVINVAGSPNDPTKLVVWCNSYECSKKHNARFRTR